MLRKDDFFYRPSAGHPNIPSSPPSSSTLQDLAPAQQGYPKNNPGGVIRGKTFREEKCLARAVDAAEKSGIRLSHVDPSSLVFCLAERAEEGRYTGFSIRIKISDTACAQSPAGVTAASSLADMFYDLLRSKTKHFVTRVSIVRLIDNGYFPTL